MGATTFSDTDQPRIYVACLAAYNNGILHGAWIEANQEPWALWAAVRAMLARSPIAEAEEWAIHDHEGFGGVRLGEYSGLEAVSALAGFIVEHGALGAVLLLHYDGEIEEARAALDDRYLGCHASLDDYVQDITEETAIVPEPLRYYID